jgi:hypothetical protein
MDLKSYIVIAQSRVCLSFKIKITLNNIKINVVIMLDGAIFYPSLNVREEHYNCHSYKFFSSYQD